jgi:8-oxo-dGTP diphosphatase
MPVLPYRIACLCDLRDERGRVLLLRRSKNPNLGLCSPIGGKLDVALGESPAQCAQREIREEASIEVAMEHLHLMGLVSEQAYEGETHWLMFIYRVTMPVEVEPIEMNEGKLDWYEPDEIDALPLAETDRRIIWPLIRANEHAARGESPAACGHGFFAVHIDCLGDEMTWRVEQSTAPFGTQSEPCVHDER